MRIDEATEELQRAVGLAHHAGTLVTVIEYDRGFVGFIERAQYEDGRTRYRYEIEGDSTHAIDGEPFSVFGFTDTAVEAGNRMLDIAETH